MDPVHIDAFFRERIKLDNNSLRDSGGLSQHVKYKTFFNPSVFFRREYVYRGQKAALKKDPEVLTKKTCVRKNRDAKQNIAKFKKVCNPGIKIKLKYVNKTHQIFSS